MPFNQFRRNPCMRGKSIDNSRNTSRNHCTREIHAVSHSIAGAHLNWNLVLIHQLHQFQAERNYKTVYIRSGDVLQVAPWTDAGLQTITDYTQIQIHDLTTRHLHLIENMIIRTADKNSCLTKTNILYQLEILLAGADPCRHLRKLVASFQTFVYGIPVLLTIQEELALTNQSLRAA